jgi:DNA replication factor GINS
VAGAADEGAPAAGRSGDAGAVDGAGDSGRGTDRVTVRVTRDVGSILGVDEREYDLASEDVVTLPATNAAPLVERGAAERLE